MSFYKQIFDADIYLMKRDNNLWQAGRTDSEPAPVSSYGLLTFAVRTGFVEYVDEISPRGYVWAVFVLQSVSQAQQLGRWRSEWCIRYAWYSSGEPTSAMMNSSI